MNPVEIEEDHERIIQRIAESQTTDYVAHGSVKKLRMHCNVVALHLPSIDEHFRRVSYILRKGLPKEMINALDVALMTLSDFADMVSSLRC